MKKLLIILLLLVSTLGLAQVDPFNVYQYRPEKKGPWFEWWYYKVVLPETGESFYFVYGVVNPWDTKKTMKGTRAVVGYGDFKQKLQLKNHFKVEKFKASYDQTLVEIENSLATDTHFSGNLNDNSGDQYAWDISIQKDWAYNATGWATGKNITNIEWYPAQAGAKCSGSIVSKNKLYQFSDAPCYQDRNWGTSFPKWWAWIVSNHFNEDKDSILAIGGGLPKYMGTNVPFDGVSIGLRHKGIDYHFRPNDFDIIKNDISFGKWEVSGQNDRYKVVVKAWAPKEDFMDLVFTTPDGVDFHDWETLTGKAEVKIYHRKRLNWVLYDTLTTDFAGIEYGSYDK